MQLSIMLTVCTRNQFIIECIGRYVFVFFIVEFIDTAQSLFGSRQNAGLLEWWMTGAHIRPVKKSDYAGYLFEVNTTYLIDKCDRLKGKTKQ